MILENGLFSQEIPEAAISKGHVRFALKSAAPKDVALVGFCANLTASLLFEHMQAQGTNIIIALGKDDAQVDVLARYENDGLNLQWQLKAADQQQLAQAQERISSKTFFLSKQEKSQTTPAILAQSLHDDDDEYLVRQLHRVP